MYNKEIYHRVSVDIPKLVHKKANNLSKKLTKERSRRVSVNEVLRTIIIEKFNENT